jgi:hypothetical protein
METTAEKFFQYRFRKKKRMAYKKLFFMVLFISAVFLVNIPGECLAQPIDNTKINKQDTFPKELTVDQQVETKQDHKIRPVQGLRILELSENPARTVIKAKDLTRKEPAPTVATDK